jgi:hypothetical protein
MTIINISPHKEKRTRPRIREATGTNAHEKKITAPYKEAIGTLVYKIKDYRPV